MEKCSPFRKTTTFTAAFFPRVRLLAFEKVVSWHKKKFALFEKKYQVPSAASNYGNHDSVMIIYLYY